MSISSRIRFAAAGAAAMWFFDPRSGDERRSNAKAKVRDARHLADRFEQIAERVATKVRRRGTDEVDVDEPSTRDEDTEVVLRVAVPVAGADVI